MPQMINYGNELIRINSSENRIEYSRDSARSWFTGYRGSSYGIFYDLLPFGNEILACTSRGLCYSRDSGRSWFTRYTGSSYGTFNSLSTDGNKLFVNTSKGLYFSPDSGRSLFKR